MDYRFKKEILVLLVIIKAVLPQIFDCPPDWFTSNNVCYKFVFDPKATYEKAREQCSLMGTSLLSVRSREEDGFIDTWLRNNDYFRNTWVTSGQRSRENPSMYAWDGDFTNNRIPQDMQFWLPNDQTHLSPSAQQEDVIVYKFDGVAYGWRVGSKLDEMSFVCEISQTEAYKLTLEKRGFDYGVPYNEMDKIKKGPKFELQPEDLSVISRALFVTIETMALGYPQPTYEWKKFKGANISVDTLENSETITSTLDRRYTLTNGKLTIENPQEDLDSGIYQCLVSNEMGSVLSNPVQISFGFLGEFSNVKDANVNAPAYEGAVMQCSNIAYKPAVVYNWLREIKGEPRNIIRTMTPYVFMSYNGNLYFSEVTDVDNNNYYCQVSLTSLTTQNVGDIQSGSKTSLPIKLNVLYQAAKTEWGPNIQDDFINVFPKPPLKGHNVRMECFAYGTANNYVQMWRYTWTREGKPMPENAEMSDFNRVLIIKNARLEDQGNYVCHVKRGNKARDSKMIALRLEASPYFIIHLDDQHVDKGSQLTWRCEAMGYPQPRYTWYKNGQILKPDLDSDYMITGNVLTIPNVNTRHSGMYQCAATNVHGTTMSAGQLRVLQFPPSLQKNPVQSHMVGALNGDIIIICNPEAAPAPTITWSKNNVNLNPDGTRVKMMPNGNLQIKDLTYGDAGYYTCIADNGMPPAARSTGQLVIQSATVIQIPPSSAPVVVNRTAFIPCRASYDINLDLVYMWTFNGKLIDFEKDFHYRLDRNPSHTGLNIIMTQFKHAGEYECIAKTTLNQDAKSTFLQVYGPPGEPGGVVGVDGSVTQNSIVLAFFPGSKHGSRISHFIVQREIDHKKGEWKLISQHYPEPYTIIPNANGRDNDMRQIKIEEDLHPGNGYSFRVAGVNQYGVGTWSVPSPVIKTRVAAPDVAVDAEYIVGGNGSVGDLSIMWQRMDREFHGAPGFGYIVYWRRYKPKSVYDAQWRTEGPFKDWTRDRLTVQVGEENFYLEYEIKIQVYNDVGKGPNSTEAVVYSAEGMPIAAPQGLYCDAHNSTAMLVTWQLVSDTRETMKGRVWGYQVNYWLDGDDEPVYKQYIRYQGQVSEGIVIGLFPDTNFWFEVQVFNTAGLGPLSEKFIQETLHEVPKLYPQEVYVHSMSSSSVRVTWRGISTSREEETLDGYMVYFWKANDHFRNAESFETAKFAISHDLYGIQKGVVYCVRVAGYSGGGEGRKSPTVYFTLGGMIRLDNTTTSLSYEGIDDSGHQNTQSLTTILCVTLFSILTSFLITVC
ncbi:contactin-like [Crassostrea virginica]